MAGPSKIEWCTDTWNPIVGCSIVSPGCTNCYAMRMAARIIAMANGQDHDVAGHYDRTLKNVKGKPVWSGVIKQAPEHILLQPLKWKKSRRIFVNSMGDLFHESIPDEWIDRVFAVMALCPQHTFQVLTKRAERMREYFSFPGIGRLRDTRIRMAAKEIVGRDFGVFETSPGSIPLPNVWLGVSAERQQEADERIPHLLQTPAAIRFVSLEPLLGPIDLWQAHWGDFKDNEWQSSGRPLVDWAIVGGESGPKARPMHPDWARSLQKQCETAGVDFFFKQWGRYKPIDQIEGQVIEGTTGEHVVVSRDGSYRETDIANPPEHVFAFPFGKKAAGRLLDGREWNQMPEVRP